MALHLNPTLETADEIRHRLLGELALLRWEQDHDDAGLADLHQDWRGQPALDLADLGAQASEDEREASMTDTAQSRVRQIQHALQRLDQGTYGSCERCGQPISAERLAALPWATLCIDCKTRQENTADRRGTRH